MIEGLKESHPEDYLMHVPEDPIERSGRIANLVAQIKKNDVIEGRRPSKKDNEPPK